MAADEGGGVVGSNAAVNDGAADVGDWVTARVGGPGLVGALVGLVVVIFIVTTTGGDDGTATGDCKRPLGRKDADETCGDEMARATDPSKKAV